MPYLGLPKTSKTSVATENLGLTSPAQNRPAMAGAAVGRAGDAELAFAFCEHAGGLASLFLGCTSERDPLDSLVRCERP
ncbi:hypothetical protein ACXZ66_11430 [Corynebacterium sp. S7]